MLSRTSIIASGAPVRVSMMSMSSASCNSGAFYLQPHFDDRLADVVSDGGFDGRGEQQEKQNSVVPTFRSALRPPQNSFLTRKSSA